MHRFLLLAVGLLISSPAFSLTFNGDPYEAVIKYVDRIELREYRSDGFIWTEYTSDEEPCYYVRGKLTEYYGNYGRHDQDECTVTPLSRIDGERFDLNEITVVAGDDVRKFDVTQEQLDALPYISRIGEILNEDDLDSYFDYEDIPQEYYDALSEYRRLEAASVPTLEERFWIRGFRDGIVVAEEYFSGTVNFELLTFSLSGFTDLDSFDLGFDTTPGVTLARYYYQIEFVEEELLEPGELYCDFTICNDISIRSFDYSLASSVASVPLPGSIAFLGIALAALFGVKRRA